MALMPGTLVSESLRTLRRHGHGSSCESTCKTTLPHIRRYIRIRIRIGVYCKVAFFVIRGIWRGILVLTINIKTGSTKIEKQEWRNNSTSAKSTLIEITLKCVIPPRSHIYFPPLSGLLIAMVVSMLFLLLLRFIAPVMVWVLIIGVLGSGAYGKLSTVAVFHIAFLNSAWKFTWTCSENVRNTFRSFN